MNRLTPYAAFFMRVAVGLVFLHHGWMKLHGMGLGGTATYFHSVGVPFSSLFAVIVIGIETVGAVCVLLGMFTRFWAGLMAIEMVVAIFAAVLPKIPELEGLLFAGAVTLIALGDGPLSIAVRLKPGS